MEEMSNAIIASIEAQLDNELVVNRMIHKQHCGAQAEFFLNKLRNITKLQMADNLDTEELEEESRELPSLEDSLLSVANCRAVSLLEFLQSTTLEIYYDQIVFFRNKGRSNPSTPAERTGEWASRWRDFLGMLVASKRDSNKKIQEEQVEEPLYNKEKDGFQHETLLIRDMIITCVTHDFSEDKDSQATQVTSSCDYDLVTYRERYPSNSLSSWYAIKDDIETRRLPNVETYLSNKIWTTKQLYNHVSENILTELSYKIAFGIAKARGVNLEQNTWRNYQLDMPGPSNLTEQESPRKQGQGSSGALLETSNTSKVLERLSPLKKIQKIGVAIAKRLSGGEGNIDVTPMEEEGNLYFPSRTNVGLNEKATSTADIKFKKLWGSYKVIKRKNTWTRVSATVGSAAVGSAAVGSAAVGSAAVGSAAAGSAAAGSAAVEMMTLRSRVIPKTIFRRVFKK